ncbi:hypothetical protein Lal_00037428 [Lupinus albus]|nr:hypothetical protein Lal_00037428 [Lupinus albus]
MESSANEERLAFGKMEYGCKHYRRRCMIRAPCCNEIYSCRHCHNEATSVLKHFNRHDLVRQDVKQVVCSVCDTEQLAAQICTNCGVRMGEYFCDICKFFDDDTGKQQFHCDECGICRVGGQQNFFHCNKCGSCYSVALRDNHSCVENSMRHHCPICYEYLFDSMKDTAVMKCGHTMHCECYDEMIYREKFCCPICSKSVIDMSREWKRIDEEIEATVMPEDYRFGYFVMTAMTQPKFTFTLSGKNAVAAVHIILVRSLLLFFLNDQIVLVLETDVATINVE